MLAQASLRITASNRPSVSRRYTALHPISGPVMHLASPTLARSSVLKPRLHARGAVKVCAVSAKSGDEPHIQLATAKLPAGISESMFVDSMYNWAATLTQSGANYPFSLPLKTDKLPSGFNISLLKRGSAGGFDSAGEMQATVEDVPGKGAVLFVRFYEGPASMAGRRTPAPADATARLETALAGLVDVDTIMGTMPNAIRAAMRNAAPQQ